MKTAMNNNIKFSTVFDTVLVDSPSRSREIIAKRFGIGEEAPLTLQAIGDEYEITRERVRQIVQSGLKNVYNTCEDCSEFTDAKDIIVTHIEDNGGIITMDELVILGGDDSDEHGTIRFLVEGMSEVQAVSDKKHPVKNDVVALTDFDIDEWIRVHDMTKNILQIKQKTYTSEKLHKKIESDIKLKHEDLSCFLAVSSEVGQNPFDKWGFSDWDEISPRGVREKALLIMKEKDEPMHFRKIAEMIDFYGLGKKGRKSHPQTVHNELIRDNNFVLVGRGVYALSADDHVQGTVKDVIENVLENSNEPLTAEEVIERVLEMRYVQPSTIKVNLNAVAKKLNKKYTLDSNAS